MKSFTLSEADYVKACFRLARISLIIRFFLIISIFVIGVSIDNSMTTFDYFASGIVILVIATLLPYFFWKRRIIKLYQDEVALQLPTTIEVSDDCYILENERGSSKTYWDDLKKSIETPDFYLLFTSKKFARIIPKKSLTEKENNLFDTHLNRLG